MEWLGRFHRHLIPGKNASIDCVPYATDLDATFEHVFDEHATLCDILVDIEFLVVGSDE